MHKQNIQKNHITKNTCKKTHAKTHAKKTCKKPTRKKKTKMHAHNTNTLTHAHAYVCTYTGMHTCMEALACAHGSTHRYSDKCTHAVCPDGQIVDKNQY